MSVFWLEFGRYFSLFACQSMIFYIMTDCRFPRRVNRWAWALLCGVSTFLSIGVTLLGWDNIGWMYIGLSTATMIAYIACYVYLSRGPWQKKLFFFSIYATIYYLVQQMTYAASLILFPSSPWASLALRTAFFCLVVLLMRWRWRQVMDVLEANIAGDWGIFASFGLAVNVPVYAAMVSWVVLLQDNPVPWLAVLATEMTLVVVEYAALMRIVILMGQQQNARAEEARRKLLENQMEAERTYVEQARAHRHDMRHYITALGGYLEQGNLDGARKYLAEHQARLDRERLAVYCENTVANALLRLYQNRCQMEGVPCEIQAVIPEQMALSGLELSTILGNVLENAWEANSRARAPKLTVRAYHNNGMLLIEMENGVSGEVQFFEGMPQTKKKGGGLGLKNVVQVLEKYGGMLQCTQRGDIFCTQIILPI